MQVYSLYNRVMRVYRYLSHEELKNILRNNVDNIGSYFSNGKPKANTHHYNSSERYIHFYKNAESMQDIRSIYRSYDNDFYFCSFEIPNSILFIYKGKGYYPAHGFQEDVCTLTEYAIPVSIFKSEWISGFIHDDKRNLVISNQKYASMFLQKKNQSLKNLMQTKEKYASTFSQKSSAETEENEQER